MQPIVIASNNQGKVKEITAVLAPLGFEIKSLSDFNIPDVEETGLTFIENALIKARHAAQYTGLPALADDSGLAVTSLQGRPGIYSARYGGADATSSERINKLLEELNGFPQKAQREAYFYSVIVLLRNELDPVPIICEGRWQGSILLSPQGNQGFGYDPIFYVPTHQCSAAELSLSEKNKISHRGQALQILQKKITE
jgi:XTP/dITP diphosphohydrolase